jgi:hypothetical protein
VPGARGTWRKGERQAFVARALGLGTERAGPAPALRRVSAERTRGGPAERSMPGLGACSSHASRRGTAGGQARGRWRRARRRCGLRAGHAVFAAIRGLGTGRIVQVLAHRRAGHAVFAAIWGLLGRRRRRIGYSQQRSEGCCSQKRSHGDLPFCEMALQPSNTSRISKFRLCHERQVLI